MRTTTSRFSVVIVQGKEGEAEWNAAQFHGAAEKWGTAEAQVTRV